MKLCLLWRLQHLTTRLAGAFLYIGIETFENWRELLDDVRQRQELLIQLRAAVFAKPHEGIQFLGLAFAFYHETNGVCRTLW